METTTPPRVGSQGKSTQEESTQDKSMQGQSTKLVRDGVIETLYAEPRDPGDPYGKSDADTMLRHLNPQAKTPDRVVIFTREGCPHCAAAREMLEDADLDYVEIPLEEGVRATALGAMTGRDTVPQVFMNGRHVGGADDLEKALYGEAGRQPSTA